jgi:hypothetical protein
MARCRSSLFTMRETVLYLAFLWPLAAIAHNTGQIAADDPNRNWFARPKPHACCDLADGKFVAYRLVEHGTGYEVKIEDEWIAVPPEAIKALEGEKNPYLEALVWYRSNLPASKWYVRCFIVGAGM